MNLQAAQHLIQSLPSDAVVIDIGGGASPFPRADYVADFISLDQAGHGSNGSTHRLLDMKPRYSRDTWVRLDLCAREPWPFRDKQFDFATCSHLLEDVRDPIWVCSELSRIAKAGYIETPSRIEEQSLGVENPNYAGYTHHRWLIEAHDGKLLFRHKPHSLHAYKRAIVRTLGHGERIRHEQAIVQVHWSGRVQAEELFEPREDAVISELCEFASRHRSLAKVERRPQSLVQRLKGRAFYLRLKHAAP